MNFKRFAICILIILTETGCNNKFKTPKPSVDISADRFAEDYSDRIKNIQTFVDDFINAYQTYTLKKINSRFKDSFPYMDHYHIGVTAFQSLTRETLIKLEDAHEPQFIYKVTQFPIQFSILRGIDIFGKPATVQSWQALLSHYDSLRWMIIEAKQQTNILSNFTFTNTEKIFAFNGDSSIILLNNFSLESADNTFNSDGICFLTPARNLGNVLSKAASLGKQFAEEQIQRKYFSSSFFQKTTAYDLLAPFAKEMLCKYKRDSICAKYDYTFVDFEEDTKILEHKVDSLGLSKDFSQNLLNDIRIREVCGRLIFFYCGESQFVWIWTAINVFLVLFIMIQKKYFRQFRLWRRFFKKYGLITCNRHYLIGQ